MGIAAHRRLAYELLSALAFLHANGIMHRDLKPANILMGDETDSSPLRIVDLGLAKRCHAAPMAKAPAAAVLLAWLRRRGRRGGGGAASPADAGRVKKSKSSVRRCAVVIW